MPIEQPAFEKLETIVEQHLEKLRTEGERFRELMEGVDAADGPIDWQHTESVANRLHNLYMGAEHIFRRIAKIVDKDLPEGDRWHKDLLQQMSSAGDNRPPVIDDELRIELLSPQPAATRAVYVDAFRRREPSARSVYVDVDEYERRPRTRKRGPITSTITTTKTTTSTTSGWPTKRRTNRPLHSRGCRRPEVARASFRSYRSCRYRFHVARDRLPESVGGRDPTEEPSISI
jgi:hypothetical protein